MHQLSSSLGEEYKVCVEVKKKAHAAAEFGAVKVARLRQLGPLQMRIRKKSIQV